MSKEFKTYSWLILVLILFWLTGAFVDSALWFHSSYHTPSWVVSHLDIFWLALSQFIWPLLIVMVLKPKFNSFIAFMSAACFGSVAWDVTYSLLTRGLLVSDSMQRWFSVSDFGFVISIPIEFAWAFYAVRLVMGVLLLVWLKKRLENA